MTNLTFISSFFIVSNVKTSVSFYKDKLGFQIRYIGPDDYPYWAIVGRDNISIMLKAIAPNINRSIAIRVINGHVGMHIFLLKNQMPYLKNIVQMVLHLSAHP